MITDWSTILIAIGAGGIGGAISSILVAWQNNRHQKLLTYREEKRIIYSKILPKILYSYNDERKLGAFNRIDMDKICGELYLLGSEQVYKNIIEFNVLVELEQKEITNFFRKKEGKPLRRYPLSEKTWPQISKEMMLLKNKIIKEMRRDLFDNNIKSFRIY